MKKRGALLILFACCFAVLLPAQQLTRFAVVDLPKVYAAFFRDSRAVREFEERGAAVQNDIDRMTKEIQELRSRHADLVLQGEQAEALKLETEINRKTEFSRDYYATKMAELEEQKKRLLQSGSFLEQVYREIQSTAEREGFTMVLNKDNPVILWYSPTVDITDKVIQNLVSRTRN